nr:MAG TPA: hypothetical protein [Caudoviricetes sp.]
MVEIVHVKIKRDSKYYYIQYGEDAEYIAVSPCDIPWVIRWILDAYVSESYIPFIEAEQYKKGGDK